MTDNDNNRTVPNALPVGYRFNEFEIKEVIGGGGFGMSIARGITSSNALSLSKNLCLPRSPYAATT
jgi:hypothetical protein